TRFPRSPRCMCAHGVRSLMLIANLSSRPRRWGDLLLAEFEAVAGFPENAEASYRAAVDALPPAPQPRLALGRFYHESNPAAAAEQFEKAETLAPEHQRAA